MSTRIVTAALCCMAAATSVGSSCNPAPEPPRTAPRLSGAYFSIGATMGRANWSDARWDSEFKWMGRGGLELRFVIFTAAVTCRTDLPACPLGTPVLSAVCCEAQYESRLPELHGVGVPFLEAGMRAAARNNFSAIIAPYLGTPLNMSSSASVRAGAAVTHAVVSDLWDTFKAYHPTTLAGIYLAQECGNDQESDWWSVTGAAQRDLWVSEFWGPMAALVKGLSPSLELSVAPYYFDRTSEGGAFQDRAWVALPQWTAWWDTVLPAVAKFSPTGVGIDTIYYQDGRGSFNAPSHVLAFQRAIGPVARKHGTAFWSDAEVWREVNVMNRTYAGADTLALQLAQQSRLVDGFVCWEWRQYLSPAGTHALAGALDGQGARSTNSSLTFFHDYRRVLLADEPRLQLRSANRPIALSPEPRRPVGPGRLTDGNVFSPPSANAEWSLAAGSTLELTADLRRRSLPSNFRLYAIVARRPPPTDVQPPPLVVRVSGSEAADGPFLAIGRLVPLADSLAGMVNDTQFTQYPVRTFDLIVPVASVDARYVRFTVEAGKDAAAARLQLSVAQVEIYE